MPLAAWPRRPARRGPSAPWPGRARTRRSARRAASPTKVSRPSPADAATRSTWPMSATTWLEAMQRRGVVRGPVLVVDDHDRAAERPGQLRRHRVTGHGEGDAAAEADPADLGRGQGHERVQRRPARMGGQRRRGRGRPTGGARPCSAPARRGPRPRRWRSRAWRSRGRRHRGRPAPGRRRAPAPRRTSHPASASAAASERPARPGPISRTVVTGHLSALQPLTEGAGRSRRSDQYARSLPTTWTSPPAPSRAPGGTSSGASSASGSTTNRRSTHAGMGDDQVLVLDDLVTDEEHVDVQGARARGARPRPRPAASSRRRATSRSSRGPSSVSSSTTRFR